jgi:hypothetical protein
MAKKSKIYEFEGICSYAQVYEPDEYGGVKNWKINLHPDDDTIQKIKDAGIQLKLKDKPVVNADGKFFTFKRPVKKQFGDDVTLFAPPEIIDEEGKKIVYYSNGDGQVVTTVSEGDGLNRHGDPVLIGNGSKVRLNVTVYETKSFGKGCRLNSVRILDLIEYDPDENKTDDAPFEPDTKVQEPGTKVAW